MQGQAQGQVALVQGQVALVPVFTGHDTMDAVGTQDFGCTKTYNTASHRVIW